MSYQAGAIKQNGLNPGPINLVVALPLAKDPAKNIGPDPTAHADIGNWPVVQTPGQTLPLAAVLDWIKHGIECMQIGQRDVVSLHGQTMGNSLVLGLGLAAKLDFLD